MFKYMQVYFSKFVFVFVYLLTVEVNYKDKENKVLYITYSKKHGQL